MENENIEKTNFNSFSNKLDSSLEELIQKDIKIINEEEKIRKYSKIYKKKKKKKKKKNLNNYLIESIYF